MKKNIRRAINILLFFVVFPAIIVYSIYSLEQSGFFQIKKIDITLKSISDQKNFSKTYVLDVGSKLDIYKGQSLLKFSLSQISDQLKNEKWIKEFHISRSWPSSLEIQIEAEELAFLLTDNAKLAQGIFRPMTVKGDLLAEIDSRQAPSLALLKGDIFSKNEDKRKKALEILKSMPSNGKMAFNKLSEITYDKKDGYLISLMNSDLKIKLGEDQFAMKSARVSQVLDYLEKKDLKARVIDANLSKKVLVRLQQNP